MINRNDKDIKFTIFTPTYNRAYILPRLYESLKEQTNKNFEWLIVDDGSTDETAKLVKKWKREENGFQIKYYFKENGGKPRAINFGIQFAHEKFFFMIDSDDYLLPDAVAKMSEWCKEIAQMEDFIGVGAARGCSDGTYLKGKTPKVNADGYVDATNLQRADFDLDADMCEAYKTEILKVFPMAEWEGEKFAPEQIALNNIALKGYKLRWHSDIIYICDYLEDGLTKGSKRLEAQNPMGYAMMYNHKLLYPNLSWKEKYHAACQHVALSIVGKHSSYIWKSNQLTYTVFALPIGVILSFRRRKQFKEV